MLKDKLKREQSLKTPNKRLVSKGLTARYRHANAQTDNEPKRRKQQRKVSNGCIRDHFLSRRASIRKVQQIKGMDPEADKPKTILVTQKVLR